MGGFFVVVLFFSCCCGGLVVVIIGNDRERTAIVLVFGVDGVDRSEYRGFVI